MQRPVRLRGGRGVGGGVGGMRQDRVCGGGCQRVCPGWGVGGRGLGGGEGVFEGWDRAVGKEGERERGG